MRHLNFARKCGLFWYYSPGMNQQIGSLYKRSSKKATGDLLRPYPLFYTLIAEVMRNDLFRKTTDTQKE